MLSLLHHPNLVNLIGYCADGDQRILVYEYMALGSLEDHLLGMGLEIFYVLWHVFLFVYFFPQTSFNTWVPAYRSCYNHYTFLQICRRIRSLWTGLQG